LRRPFVV